MKIRTFLWTRSRNLRIFGGIILLLVLLIPGTYFLPTQDFTINENTNAIIQAAVQKQQKIENDIETYYRGETYSFNSPLVIQNPYGTAPLTALLIFETQDPAQISVHVPGKTPQASIDFTFPGFRKHHEIPVYGLYADYLNRVALTAKNQTGVVSETEVEMETEPLPVYLGSVKVIQANPDFYQPGMNFAFQENKLVFDIHGDIRWFSTESTFQTFLRLKNGHFLFTYVVPNEPNNVVMEQDLLGKIYAVYDVPDGVQHDFAELPNGNLLMTSQETVSNTEKDFLIEVDRQTGRIVRNFDLKKYLDPARPNEIKFAPKDWLHLNSISYDAADQSIIISGRTQSAVIKMSYPDLKIQWILGPHDNWSTKYQPYLLNPVGDPFDWQWSQHHATILAEKTVNGSHLIDILLFDNGNYRSFDEISAISPANSYSRIVHYQINETDHTVKQVWEYGKERGSELFSSSRGSAYLLGNGNYFGTWSAITKDPNGQALVDMVDGGTDTTRIFEVNPANQQVVFEAKMGNTTNYRTLRANFYDGFSDENAILPAKINDTTVFDLGKRVITLLQPVKKAEDLQVLWIKRWARNNLTESGFLKRIQDLPF